jgi:hypothetical protein
LIANFGLLFAASALAIASRSGIAAGRGAASPTSNTASVESDGTPSITTALVVISIFGSAGAWAEAVIGASRAAAASRERSGDMARY